MTVEFERRSERRSERESRSNGASKSPFLAAALHAVLWAAAFGLIGSMIAALVVLDAPPEAAPGWLFIASLIVRFALFGLVCGTVFWWLTGQLFQRTRFAQFGRLPVFLGGALGTAVFVPLFMQAMNLLSGDGLVAWRLVLDDSVWAFFFGGVAALGSLELVRRRGAALAIAADPPEVA